MLQVGTGIASFADIIPILRLEDALAASRHWRGKGEHEPGDGHMEGVTIGERMLPSALNICQAILDNDRGQTSRTAPACPTRESAALRASVALSL